MHLSAITGKLGLLGIDRGDRREVNIRVRLARAHDDLCRGDARTVAGVAHSWGFTHLGRFAGAYQRREGTTPSATVPLARPQ